MTIILLQPDGVPITAQQERQGSAALYGGGANRPLGGRSGFRVDTPSDVFTATASAWTLKPCSIMIDPGASTHQGMYGWATDANITQASIPGTPVAPDATYPRKDIYFIRVNDSSAGDGSGLKSAPVEYLAGTPNAAPVAPALPARSFLVATVTVPQSGAGSPTVLVNPARFVAAGGTLPVFSQAERDALSKYDGLSVLRLDLPGRPAERWNGTAWRAPIEGATVVTDGNWSATGVVTRSQSPDGSNAVTIAEYMLRTGAAFTLTTAYLPILVGFIPTGFRPASMFNGWALLTNAADAPVAVMWWRVTPSGDLQARLDSGSVTLDNGHRFALSGNWTTP